MAAYDYKEIPHDYEMEKLRLMPFVNSQQPQPWSRWALSLERKLWSVGKEKIAIGKLFHRLGA